MAALKRGIEMRKRPHKDIEKYRAQQPGWTSPKYATYGMFEMLTPKGVLRIMVGDEIWDHVSVSLETRCPTWKEMCMVKDLFFEPEETVIQYHPPKSVYIRDSHFALHLWRQQGVEIQLPPLWMV